MISIPDITPKHNPQTATPPRQPGASPQLSRKSSLPACASIPHAAPSCPDVAPETRRAWTTADALATIHRLAEMPRSLKRAGCHSSPRWWLPTDKEVGG